jgi:putative ABC transport system permease protein
VIANTLLLALRALRRNLMRSLLTMLGIIIGVAAVIAIVTLGNGASESVTSQVASLGDKLLFIRPGVDNQGPMDGSATRPFTLKDANLLGKEIQGVAGVSPMVSTQVTAVFGNNHWPVGVTGITDAYFLVRNAKLIRGSKFTEQQYQSGRLLCIIGKTAREELLGAVNPVGAVIRVGISTCEIVGELESKGQSGFGNDQDNVILAPLHSVQSRLIGNQDISSIAVSVSSWAENGEVKTRVQAYLRQRRNLMEQDVDDFSVMDPTEIASVLGNITSALTLFLGAIAAVSLLVGGIGIMNIMLVSVTERTREIGIRLAIGALEKEVLAQFLVEAVILTTLGGAVGVVIGLAASYGIAQALSFPFRLDPAVILTAFVFSALVGVVFGYMPARRAARLDPIEALRHE